MLGLEVVGRAGGHSQQMQQDRLDVEAELLMGDTQQDIQQVEPYIYDEQQNYW